jgi:hypothetical protein
MAKQTINIGASPNDGTGTPLRTSFDYCNLNFTELYTATGPSGNNIVVPGTATITGDLTVDTSTLKVDSTNNRVGIGTASPNWLLTASGSSPEFVMIDSGGNGTRLYTKTTNTAVFIGANYSTSAVPINFTLDGGSSNAMTLNSTGLGVGVASPAQKVDVDGNIQMTGVSGGTRYLLVNGDNTYTGSLTIQSGRGSGNFGAATVLYGHSHATYPGGVWVGRSNGSTGPIMFGTGGITPTTVQMTLDSNGNLILQSSATPATLTTNGQLTVNATSNTNLRFSYRGSDGTTRVANITLA